MTNLLWSHQGKLKQSLDSKMTIGQRHLVECHCILPIYKDKKPEVYHKFSVYSRINKKNGKIIPKYVNCNNCGITHYVYEFCKTEIKIGKEDIGSARNINEISLGLPQKIVQVLESYNASIDLFEEIEDIFDQEIFPKSLVVKREIIDENYNLKILKILGKDKFKIISEILDDTIYLE